MIKIELDPCVVCRGPSGKCLQKEGGFCNFSQLSPWEHPCWILWVAKSWGWTVGAHAVFLYCLGWDVLPSCFCNSSALKCVHSECGALSSVCPTWWFPSWCVLLLPEVESWNHKTVSVGKDQFGFNLRAEVWSWAGAEQARALCWGVYRAAVSLWSSWFLAPSTKAGETKLCCAPQCLSTSSDRLLQTSASSPDYCLLALWF